MNYVNRVKMAKKLSGTVGFSVLEKKEKAKEEQKETYLFLCNPLSGTFKTVFRPEP